jgi:hypothetical protein
VRDCGNVKKREEGTGMNCNRTEKLNESGRKTGERQRLKND